MRVPGTTDPQPADAETAHGRSLDAQVVQVGPLFGLGRKEEGLRTLGVRFRLLQDHFGYFCISSETRHHKRTFEGYQFR